MKTGIQIKLLFPQSRTDQRTNKLKSEVQSGFTLIELLVVIVILGILVAIGMPNFLKQSVKAKQTESKQAISLINRAQSHYRLESNSFSSSFDQLAIGMGLSGGTTASTVNYSYTLDLVGDPTNKATIKAIPSDTAVRSYTGGNLRYVNGSQSSVASIVCQSITPGSASITTITFNTASVDCPANYQALNDTISGS